MNGSATLLIEAEKLRSAEIRSAAEQAGSHERSPSPGFLGWLAARYWTRGNARIEQPSNRPSWGARRM